MDDVQFRFRFKVGDGVFYYPLPANKHAWYGWETGPKHEYFIVSRRATEGLGFINISYRIASDPEGVGGSIPVTEAELVHSPGGKQ